MLITPTTTPDLAAMHSPGSIEAAVEHLRTLNVMFDNHWHATVEPQPTFGIYHVTISHTRLVVGLRYTATTWEKVLAVLAFLPTLDAEAPGGFAPLSQFLDTNKSKE